MTWMGLLRALGRRWILLAVGASATLLVTYQIGTQPGVYWMQADVVLLRPSNRWVPNSLTDTSQSLIATAGVIQRQVVGGPEPAHVVSSGVTIAHEGVRVGEAVRLPSAGGQWAYNFNRAVLNVQAVDATEEDVRARFDALVSRIETALATRQLLAHVDQANLIRTELSPPTVAVVHDVGNPRRAMAMTLLLGSTVTCALALMIHQTSLRRRRR